MPFYPGPGLGGHCIPIDPFYLTWKAREDGINTRFIELAGEINADMPHYVIDRLATCWIGVRVLALAGAVAELSAVRPLNQGYNCRENASLEVRKPTADAFQE